MTNEDQVQADSTDQTVADQTDAAESTISGTNEPSGYDAALAEALSEDTNQTEQDDNSAEVDEEVYEAQETEEQAEEEQEEEVEEQTSEDAGEAAEQEEPEAPTSRKIRFSNPEDLAVAAIAKAKKISLVEAAKIFAGDQSATEHQAQRQETQETTEKVDTVDSVQARIEELEELDAQATTALEFETAIEHRKEANKLRHKLMDLKIAEVQEKSRSEAESERQFYAAYAASEAETVKFYPDAAKVGSPLHAEILRVEAEMKELGDDLYYAANKPLIAAKKAAKNLGIPMTNPNKAAQKKAVQTRPIQPAGGNARTTAPTTPISKIDQAVDSVKDEASYDALVAELLS